MRRKKGTDYTMPNAAKRKLLEHRRQKECDEVAALLHKTYNGSFKSELISILQKLIEIQTGTESSEEKQRSASVLKERYDRLKDELKDLMHRNKVCIERYSSLFPSGETMKGKIIDDQIEGIYSSTDKIFADVLDISEVLPTVGGAAAPGGRTFESRKQRRLREELEQKRADDEAFALADERQKKEADAEEERLRLAEKLEQDRIYLENQRAYHAGLREKFAQRQKKTNFSHVVV